MITLKLNQTECDKGDFSIASDGAILHKCIDCGKSLGMKNHKVTFEKDRVTVIPSIICPSCNAHYFVNDSGTLRC